MGGAGVTLAALGTVGISARWVRPDDAWAPQIVALALPLIAPVLGVGALTLGAYSVQARSLRVGVGALAMATIAVGVHLRTPTLPTAAPGSSGLRVVTLNSGASTSATVHRLSDYIRRRAPDVVILQEATHQSVVVGGQRFRVLDHAIEAIRQTGRYRVAGDSSPVDARTTVRAPENRQVVLSQLPVLAHEVGELGPADTAPSVYVRVEIDWRGRSVALYNVHFRPYNPSVGWSFDRALDPVVWRETPGRLASFFAVQAEEAERFASMLDAEPLPYIVAGDFNATPDQWARALIARRAREVFGRRLWPATRPDAVPVAAIDGILAGAGWSVRDTDVGPAGLSDHRALSAELVLGE